MRPEKKAIELNANEKEIFEVLKKEKTMPLKSLKTASGLSNKGWDKGIKGLSKLGLVKVTKTEEDLLVEITD